MLRPSPVDPQKGHLHYLRNLSLTPDTCDRVKEFNYRCLDLNDILFGKDGAQRGHPMGWIQACCFEIGLFILHPLLVIWLPCKEGNLSLKMFLVQATLGPQFQHVFFVFYCRHQDLLQCHSPRCDCCEAQEHFRKPFEKDSLLSSKKRFQFYGIQLSRQLSTLSSCDACWPWHFHVFQLFVQGPSS